MIDDAGKQALISAIRSLLIAAGSALTVKGFVDATTWSQVVGAIMTILPIAWGVWDKYRSEAATKAREVIAVNAGIAAAHAGVVSAPAPAPPTPPTAAEIIKTFSPPQGVAPAPLETKLPFGVAKP